MKSLREFRPSVFSRLMDRRGFLSAGATVTASLIFSRKAVSGPSRMFSPDRALSFYNTHTGETLKTGYWSQGAYLPEALAEINHILRDHRTGDVKDIDTSLLDLLYSLRQRLGSQEPFHVISGFRSEATNTMLRLLSGRSVADKSLHLEGKAIDLRIPTLDLKTIHRAAVDLQLGGVGYYRSSDFVHLDVGRVRYW